jgi:hypothetical protein
VGVVDPGEEGGLGLERLRAMALAIRSTRAQCSAVVIGRVVAPLKRTVCPRLCAMSSSRMSADDGAWMSK